jgi:exodeoxyribonuclease VII small subunit
MAKAKSSTDIKDFEKLMIKLENIIEEMNDSDRPLDKNINDFEEAVALYKDLKKILQHSEKKIKLLTDSLKEEDFEN